MGRTTYLKGGAGGGFGAGGFGGGRSGLGPSRANREEDEAFDARMGFARAEGTEQRIGYLCNMLPTTIATEERHDIAALDMYFLQQVGEVADGPLTRCPTTTHRGTAAGLRRRTGLCC